MKHSTKKTILMSLVTILACVALIAGTTFAWFTDSISSGTNIIQSGNLKISATVHELDENGTIEHPVDYDFMQEQAQTLKFAETGADFKGNSEFMSAEAFAPNKKFIKLIRVQNAGSLAAKVKLYFSVQDNGLQSALWYAAKSGDGAMTVNRDSMANITETMNAKEFKIQPGQYADIVLAYGMDAGAGSEYENKSVSIACTILAAQADEDAVYPNLPNRIETVVEGTVVAEQETVLKDEQQGVTATIPAGAVEAETVKLAVSTAAVEQNSVTYEISLTDDSGEKVSLTDDKVTVTLNIGKGLKNVNVKHSGEPMAEEDYSYDAATGILTISTSSFSPFEVSYEHAYAARIGDTAYATLNDAIQAANNGDTVVVLSDLESSGILLNLITEKKVTVDLNGKTLTYTGTNRAVQLAYGADMTIANGAIITTQKIDTAAIFMLTATLKLDNVKIESTDIAVFSQEPNNVVVIEGCDISSNYWGIYQNGSKGGNSISVKDTTIRDASATGAGIFISNSASAAKQTLNIENSIITGASAVEIKHTNATITGSTLIGTGVPSVQKNNSGSCALGFGLAVTSNAHTADDAVTGNVVVTDCKFYHGEITEGEPNGYYFVYKLAEGASVTVDGAPADITNAYSAEKDADANAYAARIGNSWYVTLAEAIAAAKEGDTVCLNSDIALTSNLAVNKNVTIEGNGSYAITTYPVNIGAKNIVTFKNVNFADTTGTEKASSIYDSIFEGTVTFDGCNFGNSNWESIQITPKGDAEIIIKNCTFTATKEMKRFIHVQPADANTLKLNITIENCVFIGCEKVNYSASDVKSVIDLDYIAAGSTLTLGGCQFFNSDQTVATDAHAYFCTPAPGAVQSYDYEAMYAMLTGEVQTYTVA